MQQNELRARGIDMTDLEAPPAAAANFVSLLFISQNGGNVCLRKTSPFFLVWLWHTRHTARIDLRRRGAIVGHGASAFCGCVAYHCSAAYKMMKRHQLNLIIAFIADKACGVVPVAA